MSTETTSTTPDFEDAAATEAPAEETNPLDLEVEDDKNLDVDVPDETEEVPAESTDAAKPATAAATKTPRTKAPEGYVKPVEFAKILSEHLSTPEKAIVVPPQVVYSYVKNNSGDSAKNPFPVHEIDGYAWYIKAQEGLDWWDAKNTRVAASKTARAEKAAKKAAAPAADAPADATPVEEAE